MSNQLDTSTVDAVRDWMHVRQREAMRNNPDPRCYENAILDAWDNLKAFLDGSCNHAYRLMGVCDLCGDKLR